jgi:uncharacterized protein
MVYSALARSSSISLTFVVLITGVHATGQALNPEGNWEGTMLREGATLPVRFDFGKDGDALAGRFTSETQRAMEYPVTDVVWSPPSLRWKLGDSLVFDGTVSPQGITGSFLDGKETGTFSLRPAKLAAPPYRREDITFRSGEAVLSGTLLVPRTPGLHPGVVFVHGSGAESRWGTSLFLADRFARAGIAALVFDKRGVGKSTGDWKTVNYQELSEDYIGAVHFVQHQAGVNPEHVGIYGHSQGGTMSPLIATSTKDVAFIIAGAAIGTGPLYTQDLYRTRNQLLDDGITEPDLSRAMEFYTLWIETMRTGEGMEQYERALAKARQEKWFRALGIPPRTNWIWNWYPPVGNFNPLPLWEKVKVPVLLIYGERDRNTPVDPSLAGIGNALQIAGNQDYTPVIIPGAAHNLTIQWEPGKPFFWWYAASGYSELLTGWVRLRFSETK